MLALMLLLTGCRATRIEFEVDKKLIIERTLKDTVKTDTIWHERKH